MANRIAFLSSLPPQPMFSKTIGIEYLSQRGFEVFFLDVSSLVFGLNKKHLYKDQEPLNGCETIVISRLGELDAFVKESFESTIFIDFVSGVIEYGPNLGQVFRILKKYNAKYYLISNASIPTDHHDDHEVILRIFSKIKKVFKKPSLLIGFLTRKLIVQLIKLNLFYQKPYRIFGNKNSPIVIAYLKKYGMSTSTIVPINSRDYDTYLEYMKEPAQFVSSAKTCVFMDEDFINHPDYFLFGIEPLNHADYVSSMNSFFDYVEEKTGLAVVIAAHPKSRFSAENHPYGERTFKKGKTLQLVHESKMVIAHSSTSINFPVLFRKPIVLAVTSEMKNRFMYNDVKTFARVLGLTPVYLDSADGVNALEIELERHIDYENYLYKYVMNKEPIDKLTWEVVADAVLED